MKFDNTEEFIANEGIEVMNHDIHESRESLLLRLLISHAPWFTHK
jgi:hypothetical protein